MLLMLGFVMVCFDGLMFGLCDGWCVVRLSKHIETDNPARQCLYITIQDAMQRYNVARIHAGTRAHIRTGGRARTRPPAHAQAHVLYARYLSPTHTKELLWVR